MKGTEKLDYSGEQIFIGIDVHKKSWTTTFTTNHAVKRNVRFEQPFVDNLVNYVHRSYPNGEYHAVYEAGFSGFWAKRALEKKGINIIVTNAADIPTSNKDRVFKNDGRDSRKLSTCLKSGELSAIYCPDIEMEKDRSIYRIRKQIAKVERQTKNRIKSLLFQYGFNIPEDLDNTHWSKRLISWMEDLAKEKEVEALSIQLNFLSKIRTEHAQVIRKLREMSRSEPHKEICGILRTMPGIGLLSGIKFKLEIIDMARFNTEDQLLAWIGLIPTTRSSGESTRVGKMTKRGHTDIRSTLVECAWVAIRHDIYLRSKYEEWKKSTTANKAIIKVAVKMTRMIRHMWMNKVNYNPPIEE